MVKSMKIAIITFSDFNTNYGSMLQSFSLVYYLKKLGHDAVCIRYREFTKGSRTQISLGNLKGDIRKLLFKVYAFYRKKDISTTKENFSTFKKKWLTYTKLYTSEYELEHMEEEYDCYICGSDQIWNLECLGGLRTPYFLQFAPDEKRKVAYAASMGDYHFQAYEKEVISFLLGRLDYISVREKESVDEIEKLSKKQVLSVVDPVFLTTSKEWLDFAGESPIQGDYAVCYFVRRSKLGRKIIKMAGEYYNIPIYNLSDNMIYIKGTSKKYITAGPMDFLAILKGAKFAIGTSFHLTAFSIIFNVPFLSIGMESNRSRINNILELVGLEKNFITESDDYKTAIKQIQIQRPQYERLEKAIIKSDKFLREAIQQS